MKKCLLLGIVLIVLISPSFVLADSDTNITTVDVAVGTLTEILLTPQSIDFGTINPGSNSSATNLDIENIGSNTIIYLEAQISDLFSDESSNPGDTVTSRSAGTFLYLDNATSGEGFWLVDQLEWNDTDGVPTNTTFADWNKSWGFFKINSRAYLWSMHNGSDGNCNVSTAGLRVSNNIDDGTNRDISGETADTVDTAGEDWGVIDYSQAGDPLNNYCVALFYDCTKMLIYKWDKLGTAFSSNPLPASSCTTNAYYIRDNQNLVSSAVHTVRLKMVIPTGISSGSALQAQLLVTGTTA